MEHRHERPGPDRPHTHRRVAKSLERSRPYTCEGGISATWRLASRIGSLGPLSTPHAPPTPGAPVVEMTSGNMGAGLAVVCACLGHPLVVTMSAGNSRQPVRMLESLGAEVVLVPASRQCTWAGDRQRHRGGCSIAEQLAADRGGFYVDQFNATEGLVAHEIGTARELIEVARARIDGWVACVG